MKITFTEHSKSFYIPKTMVIGTWHFNLRPRYSTSMTRTLQVADIFDLQHMIKKRQLQFECNFVAPIERNTRSDLEVYCTLSFSRKTVIEIDLSSERALVRQRASRKVIYIRFNEHKQASREVNGAIDGAEGWKTTGTLFDGVMAETITLDAINA